MEIQILGSGCAKCNALTANAEKAVKEMGIDALIVKITDMKEIMKYQVLVTPAFAIDGQVLAAGRTLSSEDIKKIINNVRGNKNG